jgi:hypothetical protein
VGESGYIGLSSKTSYFSTSITGSLISRVLLQEIKKMADK